MCDNHVINMLKIYATKNRGVRFLLNTYLIQSMKNIENFLLIICGILGMSFYFSINSLSRMSLGDGMISEIRKPCSKNIKQNKFPAQFSFLIFANTLQETSESARRFISVI